MIIEEASTELCSFAKFTKFKLQTRFIFVNGNEIDWHEN